MCSNRYHILLNEQAVYERGSKIEKVLPEFGDYYHMGFTLQ